MYFLYSGTVLHARKTLVNEADIVPALEELHLEKETNSKHINA